MRVLVDRLLTLSRAETGEARLSIEAIALKDLADSVVADLSVLAEEKSQQVVIEAHGTPRGLGDRLMVRQALINLVDNAIKFAPTGSGIVIRVGESNGRAIVEVIDRGPGIPAGGARSHLRSVLSCGFCVRRCGRQRPRSLDCEVRGRDDQRNIDAGAERRAGKHVPHHAASRLSDVSGNRKGDKEQHSEERRDTRHAYAVQKKPPTDPATLAPM